MDLIRHRCEGCEVVLLSSARLIGLPIRCEVCRRDNEVPQESSDEVPAAGRRPTPRPRGSVLPWVVGLSILFAGAGVAVGVGAYALGRAPAAGQSGRAAKAEESSLRQVVRAKDGGARLRVPGDWAELPLDPGEQGQLKVGSPDGAVFVKVRTQRKADLGDPTTLERYAGLAADRLTREAAGFLSGPREMDVSGRAALRYEVNGRLKGRPAVFLLTVVEARDHFHQVEAVMIGGADERELLERVVSTFTEL